MNIKLDYIKNIPLGIITLIENKETNLIMLLSINEA
jgi:hypothetical protein